MEYIDKSGVVLKWYDTYSDFDVMVVCAIEDDEGYVDHEEMMYSEYIANNCMGDYDVIGYVCPECGEPIYFSDFDDDCVYECPVCEFNFREEM